MNKKSRKLRMGVSFLILFCAFIYSKNSTEINNYISKIIPINYTYAYSIENIPEYTDKEYIIINNNEPYFTEDDYTLKSFEKYSDLDLLGRCGVAYANVGIDTMPTIERGSIGMIKPTGWHTIKYDIVNGKYLYNRCHLIGYQLTGENDNEKNLITCTRQMNIGTMLEYENKVVDYVKKTNNHVLYRVTPVFKDSNLLATGVEIEAYSVEDNGKGIKFNVFIYNVQEGIEIDYTTGDSKLK
ncbi:MAG: DNA/RNA non-specific endonuclease [Bacilli bacterium]|nr:DNA/RNA non-specific endonuclease [Bacilli bacterium]